MDKRDEITGGIIRDMNARIEREIMGEHYATYASPDPAPALTFERLKQTYEYFKPEKLKINGEVHDIYGFKVCVNENIPEGVIILMEKMRPGEGPGKMVMLFVNEGKGVIYDPAKVIREMPPVEIPSVYGFAPYMPPVSPWVGRAKAVIKEQWPELIPGYDDFFEVFDLIED